MIGARPITGGAVISNAQSFVALTCGSRGWGWVLGRSLQVEIITVATSWGCAEGGVNSFNFDLTLALARCAVNRVGCIVPSATPDQIQEAEECKVTLIVNPEVFEGQGPSLNRSQLGNSPCWIGHDIQTGELACKLRDVFGGSAAVIMHQSYPDYYSVKHVSNTHSEKEAKQRKVFGNADTVFAVGPLLIERLSDFRKDAVEIVPGMYDAKPEPPKNNLIAAVIGRLDKDNSLMKGAPLACSAIADAVRRVRDAGIPSARLSHPIVKLIGVGGELENEAKLIKSRIEDVAEQCISVSIRPFLSRPELREELKTVNLCFMLSWHEGFGLVGWEAIAAGIPLIVSKNSGLYRTLENIGSGAVGCVYGIDVRGSLNEEQPFRPEDLSAASRAVAEIASRLEKWLQNTDYLRRLLVDKYSWEQTARCILKSMHATYKPRTSEAKPVGGAYIAFTEGLDEARNREKFQIAKVLYETGYYERALEEVRALGSRQMSELLTDEQRLLECEIVLRLNRHIEARDMATLLSHQFGSRESWTNVARAKGILNTALRALGKYNDAIAEAQECHNIAVAHCSMQTGKSCRDMARCIALLGGPQSEGLRWANLSLDLASNNLDKAKCLLAVGEVLRHTGNFADAISAYSESVLWATAVGHYDCLLWAALGLSDSQFLLGEYDIASETLLKVGPIIEDSDRRFPLETLHYEFSRSALAVVTGSAKVDECDSVVERYEQLGVFWPRTYVSHLKEGKLDVPKDF